jgi:hypothetical protein
MQTARKHPATAPRSNRSLAMLTPAAVAHWRRCTSLPPIRPGEADRLTADFLATRGATVCPTRYAAPIEQRPQFPRGGH